MDWKLKITEAGWYWVWHDFDWLSEEREPKLTWIYDVIKQDGYQDYARTKREFTPSGVLARRELFDTIFFDDMTWFYGPIDLKPPVPPTPTEKYENEKRSEVENWSNETFEAKDRLYSFKLTYTDERYNREKAKYEKNFAQAQEKLKKILKLRGK